MSAEQPPARHRALRRLGGGVISVAIGLGAVVLLLLFLNSRDDAHVDPAAPAAAPGALYRTPEQLLDAQQVRLLRTGDVYMLYGTARAPVQLRALQDRLSGPPDPALEEAGQAVVLLRKPGTDGVVALGGDRIVRVADPADGSLETFASYWLGGGPAASGG
ncbi:hypothetical protein [Conexibacter sp. CPCC 206217]|uniref:hypothetical protein n=1 Tax=Conexibacter sp. CPCC 206217 TaxID=3064574 RepID=UPI002717EE74|nr:hypothetical protein [Conexibacter sp. CPCC 206217]MDO8210457.1 hypothetical protein [Conexibacter sp. CPCC 206217]